MKSVFYKNRASAFFCLAAVTLLFSAFTEVLPTWVREKGRFLFYTDISYRSSDLYYYRDRKEKGPRFTERNLSIYADYGITNNYTAAIYFPAVKTLSLEASSDMVEAVTHIRQGDLDIIQRLQIASAGGAVFNLELLLGIPTGLSEHKSALPSGDGEFNYQPGFSMGWGFGLFGLPSYMTFYTGVNLRTEGFSDEWHNKFDWGLFVYKKALLLNFEVKAQQSLQTGTGEDYINGLWNNTAFIGYGGGITYKWDEDSGVSLYFKSAALLINSIGGNGLSLGVFHIF